MYRSLWWSRQSPHGSPLVLGALTPSKGYPQVGLSMCIPPLAHSCHGIPGSLRQELARLFKGCDSTPSAGFGL